MDEQSESNLGTSAAGSLEAKLAGTQREEQREALLRFLNEMYVLLVDERLSVGMTSDEMMNSIRVTILGHLKKIVEEEKRSHGIQRIEIESVRAVCSCGWRSQCVAETSTAIEHWKEHADRQGRVIEDRDQHPPIVIK